jgi:acetylornithine deacetylase/succinyl-diaminopimelate desuccinylase-like protein
MVSGGHAPNALPQRATLTVNCRIFPGTPVEDVRLKLAELVNTNRAAGAPEASVKLVGGWVSGDASPLRPDVMGAVKAAVEARYPGIAVVPAMSSGATDSVFYRALDIPSYGASALFMKAADGFAHGLNERVPVEAIPGALQQWHQVITTLAK